VLYRRLDHRNLADALHPVIPSRVPASGGR
jgi:hypothetical protein